MSSYFKLLTSFLINRRTRQHRVPLNPRRQRNRPMHFAMRPLGRIDNFQGTLIQDRVVVRLHPNPNHLFRCCHSADPFRLFQTGTAILQANPGQFRQNPLTSQKASSGGKPTSLGKAAEVVNGRKEAGPGKSEVSMRTCGGRFATCRMVVSRRPPSFRRSTEPVGCG